MFSPQGHAQLPQLAVKTSRTLVLQSYKGIPKTYEAPHLPPQQEKPLFGKENNKLNFLKCITGKTSFYVICEELSTDTQSTKYNSKVMGSVIN